MKQTIILVMTTFLLQLSLASATSDFENFFDPKISNQSFLSSLNVTTPAELSTYLPRMKKIEPSRIFNHVGEINSFDHTPSEYNVKHAVTYYVPHSFSPDAKTPVLILLHGGGGSTNSYETAKATAKMYLSTFTEFAEKHGMPIIAPSSSLGWAYNTRILISQVIKLASKDLNIDTNRVMLWGHSMGAMGLTRESHWLADQTSSVFADAGGMQDEFRINPFLQTYFDYRFIHSQGLDDHFQVFVTRTREVQKMVKALEESSGTKSKYEAHFQRRDHNPDMQWAYEKYEGTLLNSRRDLYQSSIRPLLVRLDARSNPLGPDVIAYTVRSYFWIEVPDLVVDLPRKEFNQGRGENFISFSGKVSRNVYEITTPPEMKVSTLRIMVSSKMVDLTKPVSIKVNGQTKFEAMVSPDKLRMIELARMRNDPAFVFENYVDVQL